MVLGEPVFGVEMNPEILAELEMMIKNGEVNISIKTSL